MKTINASAVRKSFARVLESLRADAVPVVIVRYGKPIAAIVPINSGVI
jgi:prevent-host-death family protein